LAQSLAKNPETAIAYDKYFRDWSVRCDLTRRYNLGQIQAMWMSGAIIDGDSFGILTNEPRTGVPAIQILESHRVGSPRESVAKNNVDGAYLGPLGEIVGWNVFAGDENNDRFG